MAEVDDEVVMSDDEGTYNLPNKKARTEVYPVGTIKKIRVFDFMTYAGLVAITPGPSLNLILGPNGTGKSSLVCAICVGLGGSTKLLGRADNLADYIRRGKKSCWIEITLSGGCGGNAVSGATGSRGRSTGGDQVIRREIKSQGGRDGHALTYDSSWMLNGEDGRSPDFLPQDKVTEFATMTPCQLLEATEKAIGDAELHGMHLKLIELKRKYKQDKEVWENNERTLQKFRLEHAKQHRDYERFEAREGLKKEIDLLQKKILWLRYIECKKRLNDAKEKLAAASATLRAKTAEIQEDTEPLRKLEKKLIKSREERDKVFRNALALRRAWEQASKKLDDAKVDLDQTVDKKAQLQGMSDRHKAKLAEMRREVSQLEADIENAPADAPQQLYDQKHALRADFEAELTKYNACVDEISDLRRQMLRYEQELSSVDRQLDQLQDPREQRLKKMEDKRRGVSEVYHWIRQNRHRFSGDVFGPVAMEVSCSRREYAGYVETQIGGLLYHFVVSSRADEEVLSEYLRSRGRDAAPFTVAAVSSDVSRPLDHPLGPSQVYSQAYVDHMMDEVIVAPPLVKHFLKDVAKINTVFICRRGGAIQILQEAVAAHLSRRPDALNMYMEGVRFQMTSSRYNNSTSYTQITDAKPAHLLDGELSSEMAETKARLESQKHQLRLDIGNLEQTIAQLNAQAMQAQTGGESLKQQIISIDQAIMKIKSKKLEFGKLLKVKRSGLANELKKPDPIQEQGTLLEEMKQHTAEMLLQGEEAARFVLKLWQTQQELAPIELCIKEGEMQVSRDPAA
ncbi:hypothetical protein CEUSTIGMA_g4885.t1 [Chlamydomonas eustigma]|uniref:Structural maintenance of chromosomes protein 5 n=1 Tax=Chlamydomonas eustigma TaxID=1157962 RepID=A0A250X3U8_9CHLO|nr:hypothetical protein CEUSTIGMA_g4885.t1 [Chlamydomonas eustigma]|eukprot:GAX77440.1 hypothetical protein CEUSTIGMA_g4885.t1 [Chlamydomonas eustigma]